MVTESTQRPQPEEDGDPGPQPEPGPQATLGDRAIRRRPRRAPTPRSCQGTSL